MVIVHHVAHKIERSLIDSRDLIFLGENFETIKHEDECGRLKRLLPHTHRPRIRPHISPMKPFVGMPSASHTQSVTHSVSHLVTHSLTHSLTNTHTLSHSHPTTHTKHTYTHTQHTHKETHNT